MFTKKLLSFAFFLALFAYCLTINLKCKNGKCLQCVHRGCNCLDKETADSTAQRCFPSAENDCYSADTTICAKVGDSCEWVHDEVLDTCLAAANAGKP
jgi:hypothetical protein